MILNKRKMECFSHFINFLENNYESKYNLNIIPESAVQTKKIRKKYLSIGCTNKLFSFVCDFLGCFTQYRQYTHLSLITAILL